MSTKKYNAGQVRGPMQLTFARSIEPITPFDMTITRVALTNANDGKKKNTELEAIDEENDTEARYGQMGRKAYVPYGIYEAHGFFSPSFAQQTGVSPKDLEAFWEAIINMWDLDHSAARGRMACRGLYIFSHESKYGNAPSHQLFDKIEIKRNPNQNRDKVARSHKDYKVHVDDRLPTGIELHQLITF